jgi:polysaccharide biosynthesis transport protein
MRRPTFRWLAAWTAPSWIGDEHDPPEPLYAPRRPPHRRERVLLIDADLWRPRIANHFGLEGGAGLTTILIGQASLDVVVQTHGGSGLDVLASGPIPPNPSELLGFPEMKDLLHEATSRYDVVILDTPPLLPVTDAAILAHIAGGALVVVGSRIVRRPELGAALESLDHVDTRVLGLVLNKVQKEDEDRYGYGYEYTYDKIQASEPVRAKAAALVAPVATAPARGIASSR